MRRANESAYPVNTENVSNGGAFVPQLGLTIREHFAAMIMQGLVANSAIAEATTDHPAGVAEVRRMLTEAAVSTADALIAALSKATGEK